MNKQFITLAYMQPIECGDIWEGGNKAVKVAVWEWGIMNKAEGRGQ